MFRLVCPSLRSSVSFRPQEMPSNTKSDMKQTKTKGKRNKQRNRGVPRTLQIVPPAFSKVFPAYVHYGTLTENAAKSGNFHTFRLNSLYDPDFTGVGGTAIGYTNLAAMYGLFRVRRVRIVLRGFLTTTGTATIGLMTGLSSTYTSVISLWEAEPNCLSKIVQGNVGGARSIAEFDTTIDLPKVCGLRHGEFDLDQDFAHTVGTNPAKPVYLAVFVVGNSSSIQTMNYSVRLVFETEVSNPLQTMVN